MQALKPLKSASKLTYVHVNIQTLSGGTAHGPSGVAGHAPLEGKVREKL